MVFNSLLFSRLWSWCYALSLFSWIIFLKLLAILTLQHTVYHSFNKGSGFWGPYFLCYLVLPLLCTNLLKSFLAFIDSLFHFCLASVDVSIVIENSQLGSSYYSIVTKVLSFGNIFCHKGMG